MNQPAQYHGFSPRQNFLPGGKGSNQQTFSNALHSGGNSEEFGNNEAGENKSPKDEQKNWIKDIPKFYLEFLIKDKKYESEFDQDEDEIVGEILGDAHLQDKGYRLVHKEDVKIEY